MNLNQLQLNKILKELDYLKSDVEYKTELIKEFDQKFISSVFEFLDTHPDLKKVYESKQTAKDNKVDEEKPIDSIVIDEPISEESINVDEPIIDIIEDIEELDENALKLKSLYRLIVKLTHPDKIKNINLNELYLKANVAYEKNDIFTIFEICSKLDIPYDLDESDKHKMSNEVLSLKGKSEFLETTYTWQWYHTTNEMLKQNIILNYIKAQLLK
jgi:hypothetical protein